MINAAVAGFVIRAGGGQSCIQMPDQVSGTGISHLVCGDTDLVVFGHCLLDSQERRARLIAALAADDLDQVASWPGSYSVVVRGQDKLATYTDLAGQFPMYWSRCGDEIAIGTDPGAIAASAGRGEADPVTAAIRIACPDVLPMWSRRSPHVGVERIIPGGVLRVSAGRVQFDDGSPPLPVPGRSLHEGADLLRTALDEAVRLRCEVQPVSSDFSGGLDSSTVAFLAARHSSRPIRSVVYRQPLVPAADAADAVRLARLEDGIDLAVVSGSADTLPFVSLREEADAALTEPSPGSLAPGRSVSRLRAVAQAGNRLHLTGEGGDAILMAAPSYLADLARLSTSKLLMRHCGMYAELRYVSSVRLAVRAAVLARTSPTQALHRLAADLAHPAAGPASWTDHVAWWPPAGEPASWLTASARRQVADIAGDATTARAVPEGLSPADLAALTNLRRSGEAQSYLRQAGAPLGVPVHAPFLDTAVVRAALSVPAATRADPVSYKPLLRAAVAGYVPDEVLRRRTKGNYAGESYRGARIAARMLHAALQDSRLAALGVIEPAAVRAVIDRMTAGIEVPLGALSSVLAMEMWLRTTVETRREDGPDADLAGTRTRTA